MASTMTKPRATFAAPRSSTLSGDAVLGTRASIGPNYNDTAVDENRAKATYDAVQKAVERAPTVSAREQDYIRALAKRYPSPHAESDWKQFHLHYSNAMREVMNKYPDDLDAATMFAES